MRKFKKTLLIIGITLVSLILLVVILALCINNDINYQTKYIENISYQPTHQLEIIEEENQNVQIKLQENQQLKILQLTDTHISGITTTQRNDNAAVEAIYTLVSSLEPDLIIITGDIIYPSLINLSFNSRKAAQILNSLMEKLQTPWAYVYGNHDTEDYGNIGYEELNALYCGNQYCLNVLPDNDKYYELGRMYQTIEVLNFDNTLNQALVLMDSNSYEQGGYAHITDQQVDWYESQIFTLNEKYQKTISSLLFFHIPLQEYQTAYNLYLEESSEVTYHFGDKGEKVCCSDTPSKLFDTAVSLGSTKAIFVGHDHVNNYSLTYKGINLVYGLSIDFLAYPTIFNKTSQRGGTLITINSDSTFVVTQHKLIDLLN